MFFMLVPVFIALAVVVVVGPALLPGVVLLGMGWFGYHVVIRHRQHDATLHMH